MKVAVGSRPRQEVGLDEHPAQVVEVLGHVLHVRDVQGLQRSRVGGHGLLILGLLIGQGRHDCRDVRRVAVVVSVFRARVKMGIVLANFVKSKKEVSEKAY